MMLQAKIQNFIEKEVACRCCGKLIINHEALICLQGFRYFLNRKYGRNIRLIVTSGIRCKNHNDSIGGAKGSFHLTGQAFDLTSPDISYRQLYDAAIESKLFSTVIRYDKTKFVHVDTRERAGYKTKYWKDFRVRALPLLAMTTWKLLRTFHTSLLNNLIIV